NNDQTYSFKTYGAMRVDHHSCSVWTRDGHESCPPLAPFGIAFSNPVDLKSFDREKMVKVTPEIPGMKVEVHGAHMSIRGKTKGRTKYAVTIDGAIGDTHGQTMGQPATVTFDVGSAEPTLFAAEQEMVVLDPAAKTPTYQVYSINEPSLRARVYSMTPDDWAKYIEYHNEWERPRKVRVPGRLVYDKVLTPKKAPDELVATSIDLAPALSSRVGQALVVVEPTRAFPKGMYRPELHVWVQATELGLQAMVEQDQMTSWATRLSDGAPIEGAEIQLLGAASAKTDAQGLARIPLSLKPGRLVVGKKGKDTVLVPERWFGAQTYQLATREDAVRWLVYDDRGMYKPGEEVRIKGWVRRMGLARGGDIDAIPDIAGKTVRYRIRDPRWAEIAKGEAKLDEFGAFDFAEKLPANANLGSAHIELQLVGVGLSGAHSQHTFQVQEFRRPEFEVTARSSDGPHFVGRHAIATLSAAYYAGGGLPDAPVEWRVTRSTVGFTPPNRGDFHFGPEPGSFWSWRSNKKDETMTETWSSKTNPQGIHRIRLDFDAVEPSYPMSLDLVGHVEDVNRQQWAGRASMIVHPSNVYAGIKLAKNFIRQGENIEADAVLVDVDGKAIGGRHVVMKAARIDWEQKGEEWVEREVDVQTCEADSPAAPTPSNEKVHCSFKTQSGGTYRVGSIVTDEHGRKNQTMTSLWVMGDDQPKDRSLTRSQVNLMLDKKEYQPGELADLLVVAPFAPAEGLLTVRRQGIVHVERFSMNATSHSLKLKLDDALVPNAEVRVDLVGQDVRSNDAGTPDERLPKRPAFAAGSVQAKVLSTTRTLDVKAAAKLPKLEPGGSTHIDIDVKDPAGRGVANAEVALVVADEAVLALSGYKTPDPISVFYSSRSSDVREIGMRDHVLLGEPDLAKLRATEPSEASGIGIGQAAIGFGGGG
ncbi:MAG TPA: MG2 domain-containing protein, partial [Labilithrix sp.]|nr:MG2 domain-containing protein [Labilithrix sp.]